jgi:hypothetical protein
MARMSRDWIVEVKMLTTKLLQHLSETVDACEEFGHNHLMYFQGDRSLRAIEITFFELAGLKKRLGFLAENCGDFAQEVSLYQLILLDTFPKTVSCTITNIAVYLYSSDIISCMRTLY